MKLYSDLAEYYYEIEKIGRNFDVEIQFLIEQFNKYRVKSILDLGCGTGEHVTALQSRGFKTTGIDSSTAMLDVARRRYPHCTFQDAEIQELNSQSKFDAVMCLFGTFNYLTSDMEIEKSLKHLYNILKNSGLFIIEIWNAEPVLRIQRKPISHVGIVKVGKTTIVRNRGFRIKNSPDERNLVEVNYVYNVNQKEIKDRHLMRVFYSKEVIAFLNKHFFEVLHIYGNYSMEKFHNFGSRILIVARKR